MVLIYLFISFLFAGLNFIGALLPTSPQEGITLFFIFILFIFFIIASFKAVSKDELKIYLSILLLLMILTPTKQIIQNINCIYKARNKIAYSSLSESYHNDSCLLIYNAEAIKENKKKEFLEKQKNKVKDKVKEEQLKKEKMIKRLKESNLY